MSTESNLVWGLLALGILASAGGYAAGRKLHGPDKDMVNARRAASRNMDEIDAFIREIKLREKEIAVKGGILGHGEIGMPEAERTYYKDRVKELNGKISTLRSAYAILTKSQRGRLARLSNVDYKAIAPTVARQSHLEHTPQAAIEHKPGGHAVGDVDRWKEIKKGLRKKYNGDNAKVAEELKAHHGGLIAQLKDKAAGYWSSQLKELPGLVGA